MKSKLLLQPDPELELDKKELNAGFVGFFRQSGKLAGAAFSRLWVSQYWPHVERSPNFATRRGLRTLYEETKLSGKYIKVKKEEDHALVTIPIMGIEAPRILSYVARELCMPNKTNLDRVLYTVPDPVACPFSLSGVDDETDIEFENDIVPEPITRALAEPEQFQTPPNAPLQLQVQGIDILERTHMPANVKSLLRACLVSVEFFEGTGDTVYAAKATFRLTKKECQYLTNTPWAYLREVDLYGVMLSWYENKFGTTGTSPTDVMFSLSAIADMLQQTSQRKIARASGTGLSVNPVGEFIYLPADVDETARYEADLLELGRSDSGFEIKTSLAALRNRVVLTDWVNSKLSYTGVAGGLQTLDLQGHRPAEASHIVNLLEKSRICVASLKSLANLLGLEHKFEPDTNKLYIDTEEGKHNIASAVAIRSPDNDVASYINVVSQELVDKTGRSPLTIKDLRPSTDVAALHCVVSWYQKLAEQVLARVDDILNDNKLSVLARLTDLAKVTLHSVYAPVYELMKVQAEQDNKAALEQGECSDYEPQPLPLIAKGVGRIPHQLKIDNIGRGRPKHMIYPVHAGGGKTLLLLLDIIQELKAGTRKFLIMCPSHLVAQYATEITFFTGNQLNCIPLNTDVLRRWGVDALTQMIDNAPDNTVVVADLDFLPLHNFSISYGGTTTQLFPVAHFLLQRGFNFVAVDESQYIANESSLRTRAARSVICTADKIRLASATMMHDSPSDLASQVGVIDPTLLGSKRVFNSEYAAVDGIRGDRVVRWKENAQDLVFNRIKSRIVVAGATRKEWGALLPPVRERFLLVDLTPAQTTAYNALLEQTLEEIKKNAALMQRIKKTDDEEVGDEDAGADLADMLRPYLARLEQYITAPARDVLGNLHLEGEDRVSPKVKKIVERIREHEASGSPGKVMIFTNYVASAEDIYQNLPKDLKKKAILYKAAQKAEHRERFRKDPTKTIMVGVEKSINTGTNLQHVSRLIKVETVWTPGELEQGKSRVVRPELKVNDDRTAIHLDWIIADNTIDITKISRLISKIISVAKFENSGSARYRSLPDVEVMKMSLENIFEMNSWQSSLAEYSQAYSQLRNLQEEEFAQYKKQFIERYGDNFFFEIKHETPAPNMKLARDVPYVEGFSLNADHLGLERLDNYLSGITLPEDFTPTSNPLVGEYVHTDKGDGVITRINPKTSNVRVAIGKQQESFPIAAVMHVPNKIKNVRKALLDQWHLPVVKTYEAPKVTAPATKAKTSLFKTKERIAVDLRLLMINGRPTLLYAEAGTSRASRVLQNLGFSRSKQFYYTTGKPKKLDRVIAKLLDKGFVAARQGVTEMKRTRTALLKSQKDLKFNARLARGLELDSPFERTVRNSKDPKVIRPLTMLTNRQVSLTLPATNNVQQVIKQSRGVEWRKSADYFVWSGKTMHDARDMLKSLVANPDLEVNKDDLAKAFNLILKG